MSTTTQTAADLGLALVFHALPPDEPTVYYSLVSPQEMKAAKAHIRAALQELGFIKTHLNAYATDDDFDRPNGATVASDELELALGALAGQSS